MRTALCMLFCASVSWQAVAVDGVISPTAMQCQVQGMDLSGSQVTRQFRFGFYADPPVRGELSDESPEALACFYVAGWRSIPIEGDTLISEASCFERQAATAESDIYNCQIINRKAPSGDRFAFTNMDCANADMDRLSIDATGAVVMSEFASIRGVMSEDQYFIGQGVCQFQD